jgi:NAD(P)H dehydrogenase (quinone)
MILLTGASGKTGKAILKALSGVENVCAFVHREEQDAVSRYLGAKKVIVGDLRDEAAVRLAMEGARAVYHVCPNMSSDEELIGALVLGEAQKAGVEHFVYHSVLHPQTERMAHHWKKLRVEERVFESGLPFTILQPAPYMQNLLAGWESIIQDGVLRLPYSVESKFSFIDLEDLAEAARIVLIEPGHSNAVYELAGTLPMSHAKVAEIFAAALKEDVRAEEEEIEDWKRRASTTLAANARSAQREKYVLENLIRMFEYYDRWGLVGNPNVLTWLLKHEPTSMEAFVQRVANERNAHH